MLRFDVRCGAELCGVDCVQFMETPLHYAAQNGHSESVQLLLTAKGNVNAEDEVCAVPDSPV